MARSTRRTKALALVAALTTTGIALSGCTAGSGDEGRRRSDPQALALRGRRQRDGKAWAESIKIFEKETGAKVEFEEKSFEQIQKTASQVLDTDAAPDLMEFNKGNATAASSPPPA